MLSVHFLSIVLDSYPSSRSLGMFMMFAQPTSSWAFAAISYNYVHALNNQSLEINFFLCDLGLKHTL